MSRHTTTAKKTELGAIRADELLPSEVAERRLGIGRSVIRGMFRRGLPRRQVGKRIFILGADLIQFVQNIGEAESEVDRD